MKRKVTKKINTLLNYLMGLLVIIAAYQALLKHPGQGIELLNFAKGSSYSPTVLLSTATAGLKSAMYFMHSTMNMLKKKKQRKQLLIILAAAALVYFFPVLTEWIHLFL